MFLNFLTGWTKQTIHQIKKDCSTIFVENRRLVNGYQFTVPSPETYPYQWFWDSCFHSIILSYFNPEDAKKEIRSLLSKQFENGLIPHIIYWDIKVKTTFPEIRWGKDGTSSITQPPMIAYAVWETYNKDRDRTFLNETYQKLYHYYRYLLTDRDPRENHLVGILNPDESGEDNSPRFDIPLGLDAQHTLEENDKKRFALAEQNIKCNFDAPFCMKNFFWVKDVPFNSIMVENLKIMSKIAQVLNLSEDANFFERKQQEISTAMKKLMLEDGLYWSTYGEDYKKIKVKTWAIFAPLFAGILSKDEAAVLISNHLLNKAEFNAKFNVPTVAMDQASFDPDGFWRGPVWIATNWFIYKGLKNYGFHNEAERIRQSSLKLLRQSGFREYFNPLTGDGLGAHKFTWGGLVLDMN